MQATEFMTPNVVTVGPETLVSEVANLFVERGISGVPVVDGEGKLVGIVSEGDLMRRTETGTERHASWWLRNFGADTDLAAEYRRSHGLKVKDVMTRSVVQVSPEATIGEVAEVLEKNRIKRVPVTRNGRLLGIVSRANLMRVLAATKPVQAVSVDDKTLRQKIEAELTGQPWAHTYLVNYVVSDGVVHFWGMVGTQEEKLAFATAAERVPGVKRVENHLSLRPAMLYGVS